MEEHEFYNKLKDTLKKIMKEVANNFDGRKKMIGDRVKVWNYATMTDLDQNKMIIEELDEPKFYIVVAVDLEKELNIIPGSPFFVCQDIKIADPRNANEYLIVSHDIHIVDEEGIYNNESHGKFSGKNL